MTSLLFFMVAGIRCAVPLHTIDHVVSMVLPAPAPDSRGGLAGNINLHAMTVPVYSMRYMLGLETRPPLLSDVLIITCVGRDRAGSGQMGSPESGKGHTFCVPTKGFHTKIYPADQYQIGNFFYSRRRKGTK